MYKKLLLTTILLSSIHIANATCTPPTTLKCNCAHPIIDSEGKLACGTSYCGDKKCMPDGSCCEPEKYCEVGDKKYCCADNQTCDTTSGCVEKVVEECFGKENGIYCSAAEGKDGACYDGFCITSCLEYANIKSAYADCLNSAPNRCSPCGVESNCRIDVEVQTSDDAPIGQCIDGQTLLYSEICAVLSTACLVEDNECKAYITDVMQEGPSYFTIWKDGC